MRSNTTRQCRSIGASACPAEPATCPSSARTMQRTTYPMHQAPWQLSSATVGTVCSNRQAMRKGMNERLTRRRVMRRTVASLCGACCPLHLARRCMYVRYILRGRIERGVGRSSCLCTYSFAPARGGTPICPPGEAQPIRTYQQWARPSHICTGAGLARPHLHRDWRRVAPAAFESKLSARGRE